MEGNPNKNLSKKFGNLIDRTRAFASMHELNIYKKAKHLGTVKWEMREADHENDFTDKVVVLLAPLLNKQFIQSLLLRATHQEYRSQPVLFSIHTELAQH